jgi:hypothetical protein
MAEEFDGLKNGSYFYITNRDLQKALTYNTDAPNPMLTFDTFKESRPDQIWMIEEVQQNRYELVHTYSTLVLSANKKGSRMVYGAQRNNQLFFVQKSNPKENPLEYWIKENKTSDKFLFYDVDLRCDVVNPNASKARWELIRINKNNELLRSCMIQFAYSGLFLDVPGSSTRAGQTICQYPLNARCNQRWRVVKLAEGKYIIVSVRSQKCLMVYREKERAGTEIVQMDLQKDNKAQLWSLHHQEGTLYIIKSLLNEGLFLGIKQNSMDENAVVVTTEQEEYAFWRIVGEIEEGGK